MSFFLSTNVLTGTILLATTGVKSGAAEDEIPTLSELPEGHRAQAGVARSFDHVGILFFGPAPIYKGPQVSQQNYEAEEQPDHALVATAGVAVGGALAAEIIGFVGFFWG